MADTKNFDLGEIAQKHRDTAAKLYAVRETFMSLITDLRSGILDADAAAGKRNELQRELESIYSGCPATTPRAYKEAQQALKFKEDLTFSVQEIDAFLPPSLKKGQKPPGPKVSDSDG